MKDTVFISHASPEDNYFALWLASKLKLVGYNVWVDIKNTRAGRYFWPDIERRIRNDSIRFLTIVSADYIKKANTDGSGVMEEINCARTVKGLDGFILPIGYDNSNYDDFPVGIRGRDAITFAGSWKPGLEKLLKVLEEDKIPKDDSVVNVLKFWYEAKKISSDIIAKQENYCSNWFPIELPQKIFVHKPEGFGEKPFASMPYTYIRHGNRIITFTKESTVSKYSSIESSAEVSIQDFMSMSTLSLLDGLSIEKPERSLVALLNKMFEGHLRKKGLQIYEQANKRKIWRYSNTAENRQRVSLKTFGMTGRTILGKDNEYVWYFAISHRASLHPIPCYRIAYHIVFTDQRGEILSKEKQHAMRRSLASDWFNRIWFERLLSMMFKISGFAGDNAIKIPTSEVDELNVQIWPIASAAPVGYKEPE